MVIIIVGDFIKKSACKKFYALSKDIYQIQIF